MHLRMRPFPGSDGLAWMSREVIQNDVNLFFFASLDHAGGEIRTVQGSGGVCGSGPSPCRWPPPKRHRASKCRDARPKAAPLEPRPGARAKAAGLDPVLEWRFSLHARRPPPAVAANKEYDLLSQAANGVVARQVSAFADAAWRLAARQIFCTSQSSRGGAVPSNGLSNGFFHPEVSCARHRQGCVVGGSRSRAWAVQGGADPPSLPLPWPRVKRLRHFHNVAQLEPRVGLRRCARGSALCSTRAER